MSIWKGINNVLNAVFSFSRNGIIATSYAEDYISQGLAYQVHRKVLIPGSSTVKIVLDFTDITEGAIFTLPLKFQTSEGQCFIDTYKVLNYSGGVNIPGINRNDQSANIPSGELYSGVTSTDVAGDDLREYIIGTSSTNQNSGGGTSSGVAPKIFSPGEIIMIEIQNQETTSCYVEYNFNWYEVPSEE